MAKPWQKERLPADIWIHCQTDDLKVREATTASAVQLDLDRCHGLRHRLPSFRSAPHDPRGVSTCHCPAWPSRWGQELHAAEGREFESSSVRMSRKTCQEFLPELFFASVRGVLLRMSCFMANWDANSAVCLTPVAPTPTACENGGGGQEPKRAYLQQVVRNDRSHPT